MHYLYGWSWNESERHPVDEMDEEQARAAYDDGPQLGVMAFSDDVEARGSVPTYTLEISGGGDDVRVTHYTAEGSVAAAYDYSRSGDDDRLFLEEAAEWLYPDDGSFHSMSSAIAYRDYRFWPDGRARTRSRLKDADAETVEESTGVEVSDHWVDPVGWGDWDRIGTYQPSRT